MNTAQIFVAKYLIDKESVLINTEKNIIKVAHIYDVLNFSFRWFLYSLTLHLLYGKCSKILKTIYLPKGLDEQCRPKLNCF